MVQDNNFYSQDIDLENISKISIFKFIYNVSQKYENRFHIDIKPEEAMWIIDNLEIFGEEFVDDSKKYYNKIETEEIEYILIFVEDLCYLDFNFLEEKLGITAPDLQSKQNVLHTWKKYTKRLNND